MHLSEKKVRGSRTSGFCPSALLLKEVRESSPRVLSDRYFHALVHLSGVTGARHGLRHG